MAELETVARPYAKALFMIAQEEQEQADNWDALLLVLKQLMANNEVANLMHSPELHYSKKQECLTELAEKTMERKLTEKESSFLTLIAQEKRFDILPAIYMDFKKQLLAARKITRANIQTAYDLSDSQKEMFIEALKRRFNQEVELTVTISPSLIGGAILEIDDLVIDGSVLGRLNSMIRSMN